jgi:DNA mismatch endonuclease, patch repair protein
MTRKYRPKPTDEIYRNMSAIRSTENRTELALCKALHARGLRYRKYRKDLPGSPDIVFAREHVAVFVDGDYWHARILVEQGMRALGRTLRSSTRDYWLAKFKRRVERDRSATTALESAGWLVIRLWESDVKRDLQHAAHRIARIVRARRGEKIAHHAPKSGR